MYVRLVSLRSQHLPWLSREFSPPRRNIAEGSLARGETIGYISPPRPDSALPPLPPLFLPHGSGTTPAFRFLLSRNIARINRRAAKWRRERCGRRRGLSAPITSCLPSLNDTIKTATTGRKRKEAANERARAISDD